MIDRAYVFDCLDNENTGFTSDLIDETFDGARFSIAGRPRQQEPASDAEALGLQHVAIPDRGGDEIEFGARLLMWNDIRPGALRHARAHGPQVAIDQHHAVLERV